MQTQPKNDVVLLLSISLWVKINGAKQTRISPAKIETIDAYYFKLYFDPKNNQEKKAT